MPLHTIQLCMKNYLLFPRALLEMQQPLYVSLHKQIMERAYVSTLWSEQDTGTDICGAGVKDGDFEYDGERKARIGKGI